MAISRSCDVDDCAGVVMNVPKEAVRDAIRRERLRAETILIGERIGISIPYSVVSEFWNLPRESSNDWE